MPRSGNSPAPHPRPQGLALVPQPGPQRSLGQGHSLQVTHLSPSLQHKTLNSTLAGGPHLLSSNWESPQAAGWPTDTNRDIHEMVHLAVITQTASWRRPFQALNTFIEFDKPKACFTDFI